MYTLKYYRNRTWTFGEFVSAISTTTSVLGLEECIEVDIPGTSRETTNRVKEFKEALHAEAGGRSFSLKRN